MGAAGTLVVCDKTLKNYPSHCEGEEGDAFVEDEPPRGASESSIGATFAAFAFLWLVEYWKKGPEFVRLHPNAEQPSKSNKLHSRWLDIVCSKIKAIRQAETSGLYDIQAHKATKSYEDQVYEILQELRHVDCETRWISSWETLP
eukprot:jgi/Tetstr1/449382/TSEL_003891.t1